jgi:hypothetical protein
VTLAISVFAGLADFGQQFAAELLAGTVVATAAYLVIERRLKLKQERRHARELSYDALEALRDELTHNRELATALRGSLPAGALPYLAFEVSGWEVVSQAPFLTSLEPATVKSLVGAYRRLRGANQQHAQLFDLTYGPTSTLSFVIAGASETPDMRKRFERLGERRDDLRQRLVKRVEDLLPHLDSALAHVDSELGAVRRT